jgi:uncharacterized membrane protein YgdD (TMEM256/DUF423 family)
MSQDFAADRTIFALGCVCALAGVAAGAFGAHALRAQLAPEMLAVFETGVRYQLLHALALLAAAWAATRWPGRLVNAAALLFVTGIVLFSGSLMLLATTGLRALGMITPLGGVAFIAGWGCLAAAALRGRGAPAKRRA